MSVRVSFAWYDLWVGAYIDRANRAVYICPLPCLVLRLAIPGRAKQTAECWCCGREVPLLKDGRVEAHHPHDQRYANFGREGWYCQGSCDPPAALPVAAPAEKKAVE